MRTSLHRCLPLLIVFGMTQSPSSTPGPHPDAAAFVAHLDVLVPRLLAERGVRGAAVGLVRGGEIVALRGYGYADARSRRPVSPTSTVFNVGSIAKSVTAWGVLRLVATGRIELDAPAVKYLRRWKPAASPFGADSMTVRALLSHTAGVSLPAVPAIPADVPVPSTDVALRDADVRLIGEPGTAWAYSGGGYMILQLLIEDVTGRPFAEFMRQEILAPLGMTGARFGTQIGRGAADVATPYDAGTHIPRLAWPGAAAADLNATARDLARFVAASLSPGGTDARVLSEELIRLAASPAPHAAKAFGTHYGLGHEIWPLSDGRPAVGHNGQNDGWAAAAWWIPSSGDGIVVLTNDSDGMDVHRWIVCDWVAWAALPSFGGYCAGRAEHAAGPLSATGKSDSALAALADSLLSSVGATGEPGAAVVVRRRGREIVSRARGRASMEGDTTSLGVHTPMYAASVAKPVTAAAIATLVGRGIVARTTPVDSLFPELPALHQATLGDLLDHTSGVPDYFQWIDWPALRHLDNAAVIDSLAAHTTVDFPPRSSAAYSNSNYVLLAETVRRASGASLREFLAAEFAAPLGLDSWHVDDGDARPPPGAADGYVPEAAGFRLSDYEEIQLPGGGPRVRTSFATTGAGGLYAGTADLATWGEAVAERRLAGLPDANGAPASLAVDGPIETEGYLAGWFVGRLEGSCVYWHDGNRAGFRTFVLIVPEGGISAAAVANRSDADVAGLVTNLVRTILR